MTGITDRDPPRKGVYRVFEKGTKASHLFSYWNGHRFMRRWARITMVNSHAYSSSYGDRPTFGWARLDMVDERLIAGREFTPPELRGIVVPSERRRTKLRLLT